MLRVNAPYPSEIVSMFSEYTHNIPVIYSVLEGQYDGCVYVDKLDAPGYVLLYTPFMFCYVCGNPGITGVVTELETLLFKQILPSASEKEIVVFSPSTDWHLVLKQVFDAHNGLTDGRRLFEFDLTSFYLAKEKYNKLPEGVRLCIKDVLDDPSSRKAYPSAQLWVGDICVSTCSAVMLGANCAELDINTHSDHQGKSYATYAAIFLIDELLRRNYTPSWSTWPYRGASQAVALKVGFSRSPDTLAFIWTENDCVRKIIENGTNS
jgi:hypothetical protein